MREVDQLIQLCVSSAVNVRAEDLPTLAQLHTNVRAVRELFEREGQSSPIAAHGLRVEELIEQLVLREVDDSHSAIAEISRLIEAIQHLSKADAPVSAPPPPPQPVIAAPARIECEAVREPQADLVESPISEEDAPMAVEFVGEATTHIEASEAALLKLEEDPAATDHLNTVFRGFHSIKGVAGFLNLRQIGRLAHAAETVLDLSRKGKLQLTGSRFERVLDALDMMKKLVTSVQQSAGTRTAPPPHDGLLDLVARLDDEAQGRSSAPVPVPSPAKPDVAPQAATSPAQHADNADATVKIATARLDALIDAVGELVIAQAMVAQGMANSVVSADPKLARNLSQLSKITRSLQDLSMSMRMVPLHALFQKMSRLTRDTARKSNKDVELVHDGGDTELDRNVVEAVSDPLVHMIRNAIDHGIEFADERAKSNKPRTGKVTLRAYHQAGHVIIEISDDGKGLNRKRIVEKAAAAGIVREGQELSDHDAFNLIFHPGLSTADRVTDISGRGVGMDVVKRNVEALRGRTEIASTPGLGSTFTIRLPLTLAVIDGLVVKVGAEKYIVPITAIERSIRPDAAQLSTVQGRGELCMVRGNLLPLVRLHRIFDVQPTTTDPTQAIVIIVQDGASRCCLLVDELLGQQQVVIKTMGEGMGQVPGISGCAILGDGNVSLILDVGGLVSSSKA